ATQDGVCLLFHRACESPGHSLQHCLDGNSRTYCTPGDQIHGFRHRDAQELSQHLPCRYSLLRELEELLRGELALGLDLAEGPNDGLQHLLASAHGSNGVTDGRNHGQHLVSRESVSQELAGRLLEPNKAERGFSGVNFELPEESLGSLRRAKKGLESDLGLLKVCRQFHPRGT